MHARSDVDEETENQRAEIGGHQHLNARGNLARTRCRQGAHGNTSSRPGVFLSATQEFLERGEIFKQKFPRGGPSKPCVSIFITKLLHRPGPLT